MVRTFTGAWIETVLTCILFIVNGVRTFTGAWIETRIACICCGDFMFAPSRVRGLKPQSRQVQNPT